MTALMPIAADPVSRRVVFVLELVDPITKALAGAAMTATADGFPPPNLTRAGQFAWRDAFPPDSASTAVRPVKVTIASRDGHFAGFEKSFDFAPGSGKVAAPRRRWTLDTTGLYEPPFGYFAVAGMVIDDADARKALAGAEVTLVLDGASAGAGGPVRGRTGFTDQRGGFVIGRGYAGVAPFAAPETAGGKLRGQLEIAWNGQTRRAPAEDFAAARLNRLATPLVWKDLP